MGETETALGRLGAAYRPATFQDGETWRRRMRDAIRQKHIWPSFQPVIDLPCGHITGFEVLARWTDPAAGQIDTQWFISVLEHYGLIAELSEYLVREACSQAVSWPSDFMLAFNLSPVQIVEPGMSARLVDIIRQTGFPLERVEFEVTEGLFISDHQAASSVLGQLVAQGVSVAIDDFGAGYSNLERIGSFPFSKMKLDIQLVRGVDTDPGKRRIAASIIGLGQSLGMAVVAEGIETQAEEKIIRSLGCPMGQGWLYSKAVPAEQAVQLLTQRGSGKCSTPRLDSSPFQQVHQLATLYYQAPVGLCLIDRQYRHVRANVPFAAIHGLIPAELEGKCIDEVMSGDTLMRVERALAQSVQHDEAISQEYRLGDRSVLVISQRVTDAADEVIGFSVVSIDVTEQNVLRQALAQRDAHFRHSVELGPHVFWAAGPDGVLDYITHTEIDDDDMSMQERVERWHTKVHPEDLSVMTARWLAWLPSGKPYRADFRVMWLDGQYRWVCCRAWPHHDKSGQVVRWYGVTTDISRQKELEARLDKLTQALGEEAVQAILDADGPSGSLNPVDRQA